jgi:hypothetical protein
VCGEGHPGQAGGHHLVSPLVVVRQIPAGDMKTWLE